MSHHSVTAARTRMLARYELTLEATRWPELRAVYDQAGQLCSSHTEGDEGRLPRRAGLGLARRGSG